MGMLEDIHKARWEAVARGELDPRLAEYLDARDRFDEQNTWGVDESIILRNLSLTPQQRIQRLAHRNRALSLEMKQRASAG